MLPSDALDGGDSTSDGADWSLVSASAVAAAMEVDGPTEFGLSGSSRVAQSKPKSEADEKSGTGPEGTLKSKSGSLSKRLGFALRSNTIHSSTTLSSQSTVQSLSTLPGTFSQPPEAEAAGENDDGIRIVSSSPAKSPFPRASWLPHGGSPSPRPPNASPSRLALPAARPSFVFGESAQFQFGTATEALTPAQLIIKEMNDRVAAQRPGASFSSGGLASSSSTPFPLSSIKGKDKEKQGAFDGKHKRVFDKYAVPFPPPRTGAS